MDLLTLKSGIFYSKFAAVHFLAPNQLAISTKLGFSACYMFNLIHTLRLLMQISLQGHVWSFTQENNWRKTKVDTSFAKIWLHLRPAERSTQSIVNYPPPSSASCPPGYKFRRILHLLIRRLFQKVAASSKRPGLIDILICYTHHPRFHANFDTSPLSSSFPGSFPRWGPGKRRFTRLHSLCLWTRLTTRLLVSTKNT